MTPRIKLLAASLTAVTALAVPVGAQAATSTSPVTGVVGSDLSLSVASPAALILSHAAAASATSVVTVTSTQPTWTLSISDNNTGTNAGRMLKTAGTGTAAVASPLENPLEWSSDASFSPLSGTPGIVGTGALAGTKTVTFRQLLGTSENVTAADAYGLTAKYTVQ